MPFTIKQIFQSTLKLNSERARPKNSPSQKVDKIIPFAGVKACLFQVSMKGVTQRGVRHRVNILVTNLDVSRKEINGIDSFYFKDKDGDYWIKKPNANTDEFRVRCTCHDFYFTWGIWNFLNNCIFGNKPRPYKRLTPPPPKGYPYRNPLKVFGMCRHVMLSVKLLQTNKYFN